VDRDKAPTQEIDSLQHVLDNCFGVKPHKIGRMSIEEKAVGMLVSGSSLRKVVLTIYLVLNIPSLFKGNLHLRLFSFSLLQVARHFH
jgi:hypothetical protein